MRALLSVGGDVSSQVSSACNTLFPFCAKDMLLLDARWLFAKICAVEKSSDQT